MHRGDDRGVCRGGLVRPDPHRRDRPAAGDHQRCALPLRARRRSGLCRPWARNRHEADPRTLRRRGVRYCDGGCGARLAAPLCLARRASGNTRRARRAARGECGDLDRTRLHGRAPRRRQSGSRAAPLARRHRRRGRSGRGSSPGQRLRRDPGSPARPRYRIVAPVLDPGAATGRARPPYARRARSGRSGDVLVHLGA